MINEQLSSPQFTYSIQGSDLQYVEVLLPPGATIIAEQGSMMYIDKDIEVSTILGDGAASAYGVIGRFFRAIKRAYTGESLFSGKYSNKTNQTLRVAFATASISKIIAIDLDQLGGSLICQKGAYLAGADGLKVDIALQKRLRVGFFGGEGFIFQRISGKGIVFINACGALHQCTLAPNEELRVDSGCLVALSPSVSYQIKYAGKIKTAIFGGEGFFYASLTGPGQIWMQSLPDRRLSKHLKRSIVNSEFKGVWGKVYLVLIVIVIIYSVTK